MKKFLITGSLFGGFALVFYIIVMPIWGTILPPFMAKNVRSCVGCYGHLYSRTQDVKNIHNPDILFLGSSHSYRGFDPRVFKEFNITSFNLGSSSQSAINTNLLLKQYLKDVKPKLVIYDVYAGMLDNDGVESSLDQLSNNKIDKSALEMTLEINNLLSYNTAIFGLLRQTFGISKNFKEKHRQDADLYIKNTGYVESNFKKNPLIDEPKGIWEVNPMQWEKLKENIAILKENNIPYILVQVPITKKLYDSKTNNQEIDAKLSKLGPYKNFYGAINLSDSTDFYDSNHLNQEAVIKFNVFFIKNFLSSYYKTHE